MHAKQTKPTRAGEALQTPSIHEENTMYQESRQSPREMIEKIQTAQSNIHDVSHILGGLRWIADALSDSVSSADSKGIEDNYKGASYDLAMLLDCLAAHGSSIIDRTQENELTGVYMGLHEMEERGVK